MKRRSIFSTIAALFCGKAVAKVEVPASEIDKLFQKDAVAMKQAMLDEMYAALTRGDRRLEEEMMKPWSPYENQGTVVWRNTYKS